jgi:hypothetical protein
MEKPIENTHFFIQDSLLNVYKEFQSIISLYIDLNNQALEDGSMIEALRIEQNSISEKYNNIILVLEEKENENLHLKNKNNEYAEENAIFNQQLNEVYSIKNQLEEENDKLGQLNSMLKEDMNLMNEDLNASEHCLKSFEKRIILLKSEKKAYVQIIDTICQVVSSSKIRFYVNTMLNLVDEIYLNEREILKQTNDEETYQIKINENQAKLKRVQEDFLDLKVKA